MLKKWLNAFCPVGTEGGWFLTAKGVGFLLRSQPACPPPTRPAARPLASPSAQPLASLGDDDAHDDDDDGDDDDDDYDDYYKRPFPGPTGGGRRGRDGAGQCQNIPG